MAVFKVRKYMYMYMYISFLSHIKVEHYTLPNFVPLFHTDCVCSAVLSPEARHSQRFKGTCIADQQLSDLTGYMYVHVHVYNYTCIYTTELLLLWFGESSNLAIAIRQLSLPLPCLTFTQFGFQQSGVLINHPSYFLC